MNTIPLISYSVNQWVNVPNAIFCLLYNTNTILLKTCELTSFTYFVSSSKDCSVDDEESDLPMTTNPQIPEVTATTSITYGPHQKLSRH